MLHRGVVVPSDLTVTGYNYTPAPNSDAYLPDVQVESCATSKTAPSGHLGTVDPPNIAIPEGGGNRCKISSSSPKIVELDRSTVAPIETLVDVPGTADNFLALENQEDMNEKGTTDDMDWYTLGQDKVKYQLNDADILDIRPVNILSCY